ncbi:MAG: ATP-binding protein, partial [Lutispora sp.]
EVSFNKWIYLVFTIIIPIGIVFVIYKFPGAFPTMSTTAGPTLAKKLGESIIILIIFLSLMNLRRNINTEDTVSYMHLFMVPLILIFTEAMFFKRSSVYSFSVIYGHVLRILCYYYLYKSIYVSSIEYSYEKMKLENIKLEEAYRELEESKKEEIRRQGMLMQQEKLALLGQMGAGIVHETRNYLTTIKGSYQLAKLFAKEECVIKHLERINKNTDEINRIMNGFLLMSKPRETELLEVSMYDLLESVKSLIISTSLVKKVDVFFDITKEERYLLCDEGQINQVILNLCKNAVEAMEEKEDSKLFIETGYDVVANEMCIHVKDNGKGITEKDLKKIGTPFYTTKNAGTGLGLYMCHQIIKEHNGRMDVCSELGKGTCFTVTLPCLSDEEREEEGGAYPNYI